MYATASRRVCSVLLRPTARPSTLLCFATSSTCRPHSLPCPSASLPPRSHLRSFARRSYEPPDDSELVEEDELGGKKVEEELEEEEERRQARGPSKAERLRLKEKEKRRQKLAMRERVDNKKDKKDKSVTRGGRRGRAAADDFDEDDAIDLFDELDEDIDTPADLELPASATQQQAAEQRSDARIAERQRQKKEMLRRRFEQQEAEEDEDEEEDTDKEAERPVNEAITAPAIVLIDGAGKRIGLVSTPVALKKARDSQLDIVTLSPPHVSPPICRVVDYADWLDMERAKKGQQDDNSKRSKTLQLRKLIDRHDLEIKAAAMRRFLQRGHQVRVQYFEKNIVDGEWTELFSRVAALVDGAGVCQDLVSKPVAVFEPLRKKKEGEEDNKQVKKEKVKKEPQQQQSQSQKQLFGNDVQKNDGGSAAAAVDDKETADVKQHAKASGE